MRQLEDVVRGLMPRLLVIVLFAGGPGSIAFFVWLRSRSPEPIAVVGLFALSTMGSAILSAAFAYYYRSAAMALASLGWLIVTIAFVLFAVGGSALGLLWCANGLQFVLLTLGLRYCRIVGIDQIQARSAKS